MAILGWLCAICKLCNPFLSEIFDVHGKGFHCWLYVCRICFWAVFLPFCLSQLAFQRWWLFCSWFHKSSGYWSPATTGMPLGFLFLMMPEQCKCINKTRSIRGSPGILLFRLCTHQWCVVFCGLWFWGNDEVGYAVTWAVLGLFEQLTLKHPRWSNHWKEAVSRRT